MLGVAGGRTPCWDRTYRTSRKIRPNDLLLLEPATNTRQALHYNVQNSLCVPEGLCYALAGYSDGWTLSQRVTMPPGPLGPGSVPLPRSLKVASHLSEPPGIASCIYDVESVRVEFWDYISTLAECRWVRWLQATSWFTRTADLNLWGRWRWYTVHVVSRSSPLQLWSPLVTLSHIVSEL